MAEFKLSQEKLRGTGSSSGLKTSLINPGAGASQRAPQIAAGAGQVTFTASNVPQPVKDQTSESVQHFMGVTAEAAMRYQDRESTYFANAAIDEYQRRVFDVYNGYTDEQGEFIQGYSGKTGSAAINGYTDFEKELDVEFYDVMNSLDPRVQEKAVFQMNTVKNNIRTKGSAHRVKEFAEQEEKAQFLKLQGIADQVEHTPESIFKKDAAGLTLPDRARALFDSDEEFLAWWGETLETNVQNEYWKTHNNIRNSGGSPEQAAISAYNASRDYAVKYAQPTLYNNRESENKIWASLNRQENDALRARADLTKIALDQQELWNEKYAQEESVKWRKRYADVRSGKATIPTEQEFVAGSAHMKQAEFIQTRNSFFDPQSETGDPIAENALLAAAAIGAIPPTGAGATPAVGSMAWAHSQPGMFRQSVLDRAEARNFAIRQKENGVLQKQLYSYNDALFQEPGITAFKYEFVSKEQIKKLAVQADQDSYSCINQGRGVPYCQKQNELKYSQTPGVSENSIQPIYIEGMSIKPTDQATYEQAQTIIFEEHAVLVEQAKQLLDLGEEPGTSLQSVINANETQLENLKLWDNWLLRKADFLQNGVSGNGN